MSGVDPETRAFYDRDAATYATRGNVRTAPHPALDAFAARLPAGGRVLDLGCGGGQHAAAFVAKGFAVTAIDPSPGLAAEAKRLWNVDVIGGSFEELDYDAVFDGVWASASLHHAPTSALPGIFACIRRALVPGGLLHASLKAGVDRRDKFGRFYCAMDAGTLAGIVAEGWRDVRLETRDGSGHDGVETPWLMLEARRGGD